MRILFLDSCIFFYCFLIHKKSYFFLIDLIFLQILSYPNLFDGYLNFNSKWFHSTYQKFNCSFEIKEKFSLSTFFRHFPTVYLIWFFISMNSIYFYFSIDLPLNPIDSPWCSLGLLRYSIFSASRSTGHAHLPPLWVDPVRTADWTPSLVTLT